MMIQKPTGYYKNVYLSRHDYLTGENLRSKNRRVFWAICLGTGFLLLGVILLSLLR